MLCQGMTSTVMTVFLISFLSQYLPKVYHSVCFLRRLQNSLGYIFGNIWGGIALNLIAYFVASHVSMFVVSVIPKVICSINIEWFEQKAVNQMSPCLRICLCHETQLYPATSITAFKQFVRIRFVLYPSQLTLSTGSRRLLVLAGHSEGNRVPQTAVRRNRWMQK